MKRWLRRIGKVFLGLCVFWALVHVVEDWRGKRAWEAWQRDQVAKGAIYDPAQLQGPPIPDADNFAKAPIIQQNWSGHPLFSDGFKLMPPEKHGSDWRTGHVLGLQPWMEANDTKDLAAFIGPTVPTLEALAEAAKRPDSRFEVFLNEDAGPVNLIGLRSAARVLNLRALMELRTGKSDAALEDVLTEVRLARKVAKDPSLISQLLHAALSGIAMQSIWEGLETRAWNGSQLAELQEELGKVDELGAFVRWGELERLSLSRNYDKLASRPWWPSEGAIQDKCGDVMGHLLLPQGWIRQNQLRSDIYFNETWQKAFDPVSHRVWTDRTAEIGSWWEQRRMTPYTFFAREFSIAGPAIAAQFHRFADRQVALDEALIVCALERYRLAHKAYPDSLDALVPAYAAKLPNDLFTGQSLHYRRDGDGFLLYSVGWNGTDEGGAMAMDGKDRDLLKGDWPWPRMAR